METKFTPGSWVTGWGNGLSGDVVSWSCFLDEEECKQLPISCNGEAIAVIYYERDEEKVEANANLIAAAPDLYESLDIMCDLFLRALNGKAIRNADEFYSTAQAALAKARGEQ